LIAHLKVIGAVATSTELVAWSRNFIVLLIQELLLVLADLGLAF